MKHLFKKKFLISGLLFLILPLQAHALTALEFNKRPAHSFGAYKIINNEEDYSLVSECDNQEGRFFDEIKDCGAVCEECVLKENGCWHCLDLDPKSDGKKSTQTKNTNGFWQQVKNWFLNLWNNFLNILKAQPQKNEGGDRAEKKEGENNLGKKIDEFLKAEQEEKDISKEKKEEIEQELKKKISNTESLAELFKLRELASWWCGKRYGLEGEDYENCRKSFKNLIKKKGDEFKEEELEKINEKDISPEIFQEMRKLYALLAAAQSARGEGTFFSTENIIKVRQKLREKARIYLQEALLRASWDEIEGWLSLVLAYTNVSDNQGSGLFKNSNPLSQAQYRYRRLLLQKLAGMDICKPDPDKVKALKERLELGQGCEVKLGSKAACQELARGNLEEAYKILYKKDKGDQANNLEENQVPEPVDCDKTKESGGDREAENKNEKEDSPATDLDNGLKETNNIEGETGFKNDIDCEGGLCEVPEETNQIETAEDLEDTKEMSTSTPKEDVENNICRFEIIPDSITGWNFTVSDCERTENSVYECILECGPLPPQKIFNREEELCYETAGGFVDKSSEVVCRRDPLPPQEVEICVNDCLNR